MIKNAELYAQDASKVYMDEIVDMIVCTTANVIGYNLAIFQNIGGQAIIIFTQCINKNTCDTLYLKYDYCPGFDSTNHYSTIVTKKNEVQQPTQPPASKPTPPPPNQLYEQLQEESSENEEPVNIEHIQNQIDDLQKKQKKNPHKKGKGIESTSIILKMLTLI